MQNSMRSDSVSSERAALRRKASGRANSVPMLKINHGDSSDAKVVINVEKFGALTPKVENRSSKEFSTARKESDPVREREGSCVAESVGISINTDIDCPKENPEEPPQVSPSAHVSRRNTEEKPVIPAMISTATNTSDRDENSDGALESPPPSPELPRPQNAPERPNKLAKKSITSSIVSEKRDSTDYKLEQNDKLLANLGPLPQIVKTQAPIKKKSRSRDLLARLLSRGGVEETDLEYDHHGAGAGGGSGSEDGGSGAALGADGRLLQAPDGRVRVEGAEEPEGESSFSILLQVMLPFLVAGLGMVGAGLVLDIVQHWDVFTEVSELFIMVPALLGLKGNLEMTLASRLSTHANMGHLDKTDDCVSMIVGNLALIQCQAIVVGFLASVAAVVMGWIPEGEFNFLHALLLCAGALVTASFASFILGVIMVAVILLSRKVNINPDNVATPIAASLGDLTTLGLLAWIASLLYDARASEMWLAPLIIAGYLLSLPLWVWLASRNKHTKEVLYSGWTPVISAMMISSMGGVILDYTVSSYKGIAVYQPVINGVGGNLVAVQASRISTALHLATPLGRLPRYAERLCHNPGTVFCTSSGHARTARVLLLLVIPGHLVFAYTISYLKAGHTSLTPIFVIVYLCAALIQVVVLLYMSVVMVHWMWSVCIDPDNSAIPYLTACGDLLGTGLLAIAFHLLYLVGDKDSDLGD